MISEKYNIFNRETMQCTYNLTKAEIKSTYQCIIPIETKQNSWKQKQKKVLYYFIQIS